MSGAREGPSPPNPWKLSGLQRQAGTHGGALARALDGFEWGLARLARKGCFGTMH